MMVKLVVGNARGIHAAARPLAASTQTSLGVWILYYRDHG